MPRKLKVSEPTANEIRDLYWGKMLSVEGMSRILGISDDTLRHRMKRHGIRVRNYSEALSLSMREGRRNQKGARNSNWKGGRKKVNGYVYLRCPEHPATTRAGYVLEHRLVWEKTHKRILPPDWAVHHLNGVRHDNRVENLVAMPWRKHDTHSIQQALQERIRLLEGRIKELEGNGTPRSVGGSQISLV